MRIALLLLVPLVGVAAPPTERITLRGLEQPVEVLRDRWGVPHIYARSQHDLFFAQGWMAARDRLFQIDLWRRVGAGRLAEVLGPGAVERDRFARLVRFRGDWNAEWLSYAPDAREIATAFTSGINARVQSLGSRRPPEFERAGYAPALWAPEDVVARMAGLVMSHNFAQEVLRALDIRRYGLDTVTRLLPPDPKVPIQVAAGIDLDIPYEVVRGFAAATGAVDFPLDAPQGSNNWVVDGTMTATGKPLLANDPHRSILNPSLRKTVHLVAPGWNAIGAGEPALPGIALGHNDQIAFGFTICPIDQQDLYVERLNPRNPEQYWYRGAWRRIEVERQRIGVKGEAPRDVELRYTVHGPMLYHEPRRNRAFVLRWTGSQPGGAGYMPALAIARARNWREFLAALERYHLPSENMLYADRAGNIGWRVAGLAPVRGNWSGLLPVPGDGYYEWDGFLRGSELPASFNPPAHFIVTANHNILPPGYSRALSYEWSASFRAQRIAEMLRGRKKLTVADFERMQYDVVSLPARRFQNLLRKWQPATRGRTRQLVDLLLAWDCRVTASSREALLYELWMARLPRALFGAALGLRVELETTLRALETGDPSEVLTSSLQEALRDLERRLGPDPAGWQWGRVNTLDLRHLLRVPEWSLGPLARPGDAYTVNAAGMSGGQAISGASWREIIDLADWDRSVITNVPGESGDPSSPHYRDLLEGWVKGEYHPLPFTRRAVEAATVERLLLEPGPGPAAPAAR